MKVLIVGKFPPIQGGVSAQTHRFAHVLARRGHSILVVTNAREVEAPFRMWMREEDWSRCEASPGEGYVRVLWTSPTDRQQFHIPMASPFVTKLASLGLDAVQRYGADVVLSYYAEPYAVAGHLIAEAAGLPHVVRLAGSDAGTLANPIDDVLAATCVAMAGAASFPDPSPCASGGGSSGGSPGKGKPRSGSLRGFEHAAAVQARHQDRLLSQAGVVGVGIGADAGGRATLEVFVGKPGAGLGRELPQVLEGVSVRIRESGPFEAR